MFLRPLVLALLITFAATGIMQPAGSNMTVITQNPSNISKEAADRIASASAAHRRLFTINVIWLTAAGLITVWLTWRVWVASNDEQSAITAAANERISAVEGESATAKTSLAKVEIELAEAKTRQAEAEAALLALQQKIRARHLPEREKFVAFLKNYERGPVEIQYSANDPESRLFALEIESAFKEAGWNEVFVNNNVLLVPQPIGLALVIQSTEAVPDYAGSVQEAFKLIDLPIRTELDEHGKPGSLILKVGAKPVTD
jgi:hypothetical protein